MNHTATEEKQFRRAINLLLYNIRLLWPGRVLTNFQRFGSLARETLSMSKLLFFIVDA
jgi:hypothetical protein